MQKYGNLNSRLAKQFKKRDKLFDDLRNYFLGLKDLKDIVKDVNVVHNMDHYVSISLNENCAVNAGSVIKELILNKARKAKFILSPTNDGLKFSILTENIATFSSDKVFEVRSKLQKVNLKNNEPSAQVAEAKEQTTKLNSKSTTNQKNVFMNFKKAKNVNQLRGQLLTALVAGEFNAKEHYFSIIPNQKKGKNTINCRTLEATSNIKLHLEEFFGGMYELSLKEGKKAIIVMLGEVEQKPTIKKSVPKKIAKKSTPKKAAKKVVKKIALKKAVKKTTKKAAPKVSRKYTKKTIVKQVFKELTPDAAIKELKNFMECVPGMISLIEGFRIKEKELNEREQSLNESISSISKLLKKKKA